MRISKIAQNSKITLPGDPYERRLVIWREKSDSFFKSAEKHPIRDF